MTFTTLGRIKMLSGLERIQATSSMLPHVYSLERITQGESSKGFGDPEGRKQLGISK